MRSPTRPAVLDTKRTAEKQMASKQTGSAGPRGMQHRGQQGTRERREGGQQCSGASMMMQGPGRRVDGRIVMVVSRTESGRFDASPRKSAGLVSGP